MLDLIRRNSQSWIVKLIFGVIIVVFVFWGFQAFDSSNSPIIASVNEENIASADFDHFVKLRTEEIRRVYPDITSEELKSIGVTQEVLQRLIMQAIMRQEAAKLGLSVSPQELYAVISAYYPQFRDKNGLFDKKAYDASFTTQGRVMVELEQNATDELLLKKLTAYVQLSGRMTEQEIRTMYEYENEKREISYALFASADYLDKVGVTPEEVVSYYEKNKEQFKVPANAEFEYLKFDIESLQKAEEAVVPESSIAEYYGKNQAKFILPESFQAQHILIAAPALANVSPEAVAQADKARERINSLEARLKQGQDFSALAKEFSDDAGSKQSGGDLGLISRGMTVPQFEAALLSLKPGEVSQVVRTDYGFHLIKLIKAVPSKALPLADATPEIRTLLARDKAYESYTNAQEEVEDSIIRGQATMAGLAASYKLTVKSTGLSDFSNLAAALGVKPELMPDIAKLKPGTLLSDPLPVKSGFVVVQVKQILPARTLEQSEVQDKISDTLKTEKADALARQDAETALKALSGGQTLAEAAKGKESKIYLLQRNGSVPELGSLPGLAKDAFTVAQGAWLPNAYPASSGMVIARVSNILPSAEADWGREKAGFVAAMNKRNGEVAFQLFMGTALKSAKITINEQDRLLQ